MNKLVLLLAFGVFVFILTGLNMGTISLSHDSVFVERPNFEIHIYEEKGPFKEFFLRVNIQGVGNDFIVDKANSYGKTPAQACRDAGFRDVNFPSLTGHVCTNINSMEHSVCCHRIVPKSFNSVSLLIDGQVVDTFDSSGRHTSVNLANYVNEKCGLAFLYHENCAKGGNCDGSQMECVLQGTLKADASLMLESRVGKLVTPQPPPDKSPSPNFISKFFIWFFSLIGGIFS